MKRYLPLFSNGRLIAPTTIILILLAALAGCSTVDIADQRLVSKPNMVFSDSDVFDYSNGAHSIMEPGTAGSGGGQASGCTSCK